jgi:hypothetical protein
MNKNSVFSTNKTHGKWLVDEVFVENNMPKYLLKILDLNIV